MVYSYQGGRVYLSSVVRLKFTRLFGTDESQTLPRFLSPITERQCKDKHFFINDVHCELLFFKKTSFFLKSATAATVLFHISMCFFVLRVQRYGKKTRNGRNGTTISSISLRLILRQLITVDKGAILQIGFVFQCIGTDRIHGAVV